MTAWPTTDSGRYTAIAKTLHWLIAAAILGMLVLGWVMGDLPNGGNKFAAFQWHKSIGITILLLSLARLAWRLTHTAPPLPSGMPAWEKFAAHATHILFYALMIGMPLAGWAIVSTSSLTIPTMLYGVIPWPHLPLLPELANKKEIHEAAEQLHGLGAYLLAALIVLHIGAALKHHFINRDDILARMAPAALSGILNRLRGVK